MNHSYRFYAETDVFEAIASVQQRYNIDPKRIVIRGHSMGGHRARRGSGLQNPNSSRALEASAGYVETNEYAATACRKRADAVPGSGAALLRRRRLRAERVQHPGGRLRRRKRCAVEGVVRFREALVREGFQLTQESPYKWTTKDLRALFLVGPKTGHAWHPESKIESEAFLRKALDETAGKSPNHVRFVTYTTRWDKRTG